MDNHPGEKSQNSPVADLVNGCLVVHSLALGLPAINLTAPEGLWLLS
jgi:hypothetical protein